MHIVRVPDEARTAFLHACERLREFLADAEPGPLTSQVCRSATDGDHWIITHDWWTVDDFQRWKSSSGYGEAMGAIERHASESRLLVFTVAAEFENRKRYGHDYR